MKHVQELIDAGNKIIITSGEGTGPGNVEEYASKRTIRAIKTRVTKETCRGDRWANAAVWSHSNDYGDVWINILTGEYIA